MSNIFYEYLIKKGSVRDEDRRVRTNAGFCEFLAAEYQGSRRCGLAREWVQAAE
jgi:hypothetical protein